IDRRIASSFPALSTRVRLQDIADLLASGLAARLDVDDGRPLLCVNLGGGPAADTLNALIVARAARPRLLDGRDIRILVLDVDAAGPEFGARALEALSTDRAPLHSLTATFEHITFDWANVERLGTLLAQRGASDALTIISSEGALFEYGDDEQIAANLLALRKATARDAIVCGSTTRDTEVSRALRVANPHPVHPRSADAFATLVAAAGWRIDRRLERPLADHVRLTKAEA